MLVENVLDS